MALDEQMQAAIQEDIADTRSKEDRLKDQMEGLTRMGVSAVASPILGAGDIVDVASSIPEMPPKAAVMFPTIAGLQSGFNAAKQAGLDRKKAEELIEYITGVELQGDSVELFGEIVGIPGGASILKGVTDVIKKYGDAAPKYINKIKAEAKELFRTASVGDDIDGMATATAGASRETVPTSVKPDLPDTSISPSIIEESTPSGSPAGNVVAKTTRKNKSPIRKLFDKLPQKERNALPTQPDENRIFGYHGTARARERDEPFFDINFARKNDQFLGEGFYFTLDPEIASEYSSLRAIGTVSNTPETRVTPKDLNFLVADTNIKPEYIRDVDSKKRDGFGNSIPTGSLLKTPEGQYYTISSLQKGEDIYGQPIAKGQSISRFDLSNLEKPYVVRTKKQREELQAKIPELKKEGYDSILFADFKDRSKQVMVFPEHMDKINSDAINYAQGGTVMKKQMELFEPVEGAFDEGGLMQEGGTVDPESGNEVPVGSTQEEVRDDIPAQLSEGEFVFPADVVRYIGLEKLMQMRQEAKRGLEMMDKMGQMGNSDEAVIPDDVPFDMSDLDMEDDGVLEFQTGGFVQPQGFTGIAGYQPSQFTGYTPQFTPYTPAPMPTGQTMAQQYTPAAQQFTPTIDQQAPTFTNLTGAAQPSPGGYDEMRTYVNDAGMEMQIPFKDGKPIYPIPEGYKVKGEAVDTTTDVKTETTQTAAPEQQDSGDEPSDPFAGKQTVNLGGTVVTEATKGRKEGEVSGFRPGQVRGSTRYSIGSASSVTGDLSKRTTADKEGVNRVFAGLKDSIAEFGRGLANQDQKTLTKEDGSKITLSEALFESIMGDRFSGKTNEVLADIFEIQSTIEKNFGENYNKDLDNRQAKEMAKAAGIEYKGQSLAELIATGVDSQGNRLKDSFGKDPEIKKTKKEQQLEQAQEKGAEKKAEREAAIQAAATYGISATNPDGSRKSASQIRNEMQAEQKARADAARERLEQARSSGSYQQAQDDGFGGTGYSSGTDFGGTGYETSTGEAMVAEGGLIKKAKLAQQMKQSGLASKK